MTSRLDFTTLARVLETNRRVTPIAYSRTQYLSMPPPSIYTSIEDQSVRS